MWEFSPVEDLVTSRQNPYCGEWFPIFSLICPNAHSKNINQCTTYFENIMNFKGTIFLNISCLQKMPYFRTLLHLYSERLVQVAKPKSDPNISSDTEYWPISGLCFNLIKRVCLWGADEKYVKNFSQLWNSLVPMTWVRPILNYKAKANLIYFLNEILTIVEGKGRKTKGITGESKRCSGLGPVPHM